MDSWTPWNGGENADSFPEAAEDSRVDVEFRNGDRWFSEPVTNLWWDHTGEKDDIVVWRLTIVESI